MDLQAFRRAVANLSRSELEQKYEDASREIEYLYREYTKVAEDNRQLLARLSDKVTA